MASVQAAKIKLNTKSVLEKYNALKEIEGGKSAISVAKKYGVAKNTVSTWNPFFRSLEAPRNSKARLNTILTDFYPTFDKWNIQ